MILDFYRIVKETLSPAPCQMANRVAPILKMGGSNVLWNICNYGKLHGVIFQ